MDFNSCVLNSNVECQYIQDSDPNDYGGHRSLLSHFCGHTEVSTVGWVLLTELSCKIGFEKEVQKVQMSNMAHSKGWKIEVF